jgi:hypothetical protein
VAALRLRSGRAPQAQAAAAVAGSRATGLDVELGALTAELRLGDVPAIGESSQVGEPLAEHRGDEGPGNEHDRPYQRVP